MAFTTQWAQGSRKSQGRYGDPDECDEDPLGRGLSDEFDKTLQVSLWNQAKRALDDCAETNSFKVAMAEILFSLTLKYADEQGDGHESLQGDEHNRHVMDTELRIQTAIDEGGHSVYLERGARRLHVLKRRSETFEKLSKGKARKERINDERDVHEGESEEKTTMKLVYWLAIMFDTIAAAVAERPVTVSDDESKEHSAEGAGNSNSSTTSESDERWNDRYIIRRHQRLAPLRWPCPEEAIARELRDAAPVKVLLFRKLTGIQSLSSRGASQQVIEDAIQDGLSVYLHWNLTYGPLFQDCIECHDSLPANVQSWYVCLLGHWLLAVMILADCVRLADEQDLSMPLRARDRAEAGLVEELRGTAMRAVSDLARVSTPREDGMSRLTEFHPAVTEGALLTEPWTMMLIRTFSMGGTLLLNAMKKAKNSGSFEGGPVTELYGRCEDCVRALWYLGRKSGLSRQVAGILVDDLRHERLQKLNIRTQSAEAGTF
ncbi:Regulatory protein alcR [Colletotrichum chlorophyti]|uniref:Regulatory protein alcR n=1 Tax=Colletotrichum chlorophyti TaxID=708187 RepID=A0A1Q8S8T2_9PEZI|nr:Regulatory protein alcR [Colletotrichum chlorophyti]